MTLKTMRRHYIDIKYESGQRQLHYRTAGDASLPVLLMVHQTPSSSVMFESLAQRLSNRFYCVAPDMPGFGQSDALDEIASVAAYAAALAELLKGLDLEHGFLFGHHTGAAVVVQMAFNNPALASSIALSGPTLLSEKLKEVLPTKAQAFPLTEDGSHLSAMWQRMRAKDAEAPLELSLRETLLGLSLGEQYPGAYQAVIEHDFESQLAAINCPVLVFAGDQDPLYGQLDASYSLLKRGEKAVLKGIGSYSCDRRSGEVAGLLDEFFGAAL
jgi:pimeloyl-ACP methyl ester carboxylesterase